MADGVDRQRLEGMRAGLRADRFQRVLESYLRSVGGQMRALQRAYHAGDADGVWRAAHTITGATALLGIRRVHAACRAIADTVRDGGWPTPEEVQAAGGLCEDSMATIRAMMAAVPGPSPS